MKSATISSCGFPGEAADLGLTILKSSDLGRGRAEQFIHGVFARAYAADVKHFLPQLMTLQSAEGEILAALGMRFAKSNGLFLEQYLDVAIEQAVARAAHTAVARSSVVELGNLASHQRGGLRCLIIGLTAYLKGAGVKWATFTAVPAVYNAFVKMGIPLYELGSADRARLTGDSADWGTYYEHSPRVVAGNVEAAYAYLAGAMNQGALNSSACCFWEGAYRMGRECTTHSGGVGANLSLNAGC